MPLDRHQIASTLRFNRLDHAIRCPGHRAEAICDIADGLVVGRVHLPLSSTVNAAQFATLGHLEVVAPREEFMECFGPQGVRRSIL